MRKRLSRARQEKKPRSRAQVDRKNTTRKERARAKARRTHEGGEAEQTSTERAGESG